MPDNNFALAARLEADTAFVCDLELCRVLLMDDARYPWLILVPRLPDATEVFDLDASQQQTLMAESVSIARLLKELTCCDKINIATLGNSVSQLHIHVVARFKTDAAWPNPVWGFGNSQKLTQKQKSDFVSKILENKENMND